MGFQIAYLAPELTKSYGIGANVLAGVLYVLSKKGTQEITVSESFLSECTGIAPRTVTRIKKLLIEEGFVSVTTHHGFKKASTLSTTQKLNKLLETPNNKHVKTACLDQSTWLDQISQNGEFNKDTEIKRTSQNGYTELAKMANQSSQNGVIRLAKMANKNNIKAIKENNKKAIIEDETSLSPHTDERAVPYGRNIPMVGTKEPYHTDERDVPIGTKGTLNTDINTDLIQSNTDLIQNPRASTTKISDFERTSSEVVTETSQTESINSAEQKEPVLPQPTTPLPPKCTYSVQEGTNSPRMSNYTSEGNNRAPACYTSEIEGIGENREPQDFKLTPTPAEKEKKNAKKRTVVQYPKTADEVAVLMCDWANAHINAYPQIQKLNANLEAEAFMTYWAEEHEWTRRDGKKVKNVKATIATWLINALKRGSLNISAQRQYSGRTSIEESNRITALQIDEVIRKAEIIKNIGKSNNENLNNVENSEQEQQDDDFYNFAMKALG